MKVSELIIKLNLIEKQYGDLDVIYSSDENGSSYHPVNYIPTVGCFEESDFMIESKFDSHLYETNAVCIN